MEYQPRKLAVGEKIYIEKRYGWSNTEYYTGVVARVTPTGRIVVKYGNLIMTETTFNERGHKMGDHYGAKIDWTPFEIRTKEIERSKRLYEAVNATQKIFDLEKPRLSWDLESLNALLDKIVAQTLVAETLAKGAE